MTTFFDLLTVACFCCMVIAFFQLTRRDMRTLMQLFLAGLAFAAANQVGNAGWTIMASCSCSPGPAMRYSSLGAAMPGTSGSFRAARCRSIKRKKLRRRGTGLAV